MSITKNSRLLGNVAVLIAILVIAAAVTWQRAHAASAVVALPNPTVDAPLAAKSGSETTVLAGGCFWGIQAVFQHVKGVKEATSGYSGGSVPSPDYEQVSSGETGHAESVKITFDPSQISYGQLLKVFFSVALDPTQLNRQGPVSAKQYRSALFYANPEQQRVAQAYIAQLDKAGTFKHPIVTQLTQLNAFYPAETYHQDYATLHPENPYIYYNDLPKVENLKKLFPNVY